jgi:hypothetical protein
LRKLDRRNGAVVGAIREPHPPPVRENDPLNQGEAQAQSTPFSLADEGFEDAIEFGGFQTGAAIGDLEKNLFSRDADGQALDRTTMNLRVLEQVHQRAHEETCVDVHEGAG